MAENIAVLNLGSQNISLGLFEVAKSKIALKKYAVEGVLADPANEAIRNTQVRAMLQEMVQSLGLSSVKVLYTVSGQAVFTRFVKLPGLAGDNIEQLVGFEAQQHIPFPIDEVAWDWELLDDSGAEKEVAIVAIKKNLLNEMDELVEAAELVSTKAGSSPIALANSFYHSYPEEAQSVLLIDAGAKSTNLIFIEGKKIFIRSINTTGVGVTTAISKEYQVDYPTAEGYKTNSGCIALNGEYYAQWDEATGALASVITNAVTRLPSDITRTINYYRSQHGGSPPTKIFLAGGGSNLPYLKEFLEEKHSLPVEYFNPFNRIAVGPAVNQEALAGHAHQLGELVGLATTAAETSVLSIDLVPDSIMARREDAKKKPFFIASAAAVIVGSLVWAGTQFYNNAHAQKQIAKLDGEIQALQPFKRQLDKLNRDQKALDNKSADLSKLVMDRYTSVDRLDELRTYFTSEVVWLDSIQDLVSYEFVALKETPSVGESLLVSPSFETMTYGNSAVEEFSDKEAQVNAVMIKGFWRDNPQNQQVVYGILEKIKSAKESAFTFELDGKKLDDNMVLQIQSTIPTEQDKATFSMLLPLASPISIAQ